MPIGQVKKPNRAEEALPPPYAKQLRAGVVPAGNEKKTMQRLSAKIIAGML